MLHFMKVETWASKPALLKIYRLQGLAGERCLQLTTIMKVLLCALPLECSPRRGLKARHHSLPRLKSSARKLLSVFLASDRIKDRKDPDPSGQGTPNARVMGLHSLEPLCIEFSITGSMGP